MTSDARAFLDVCAKMKEVDFQTRVVAPFLTALGAIELQHTHGSNERGKDFLYLMPAVYGTIELHACVVKNGKFSGRSNSSNSVQTALQQISMSKEVAATHPQLPSQDPPRRILFISTHSLPDSATGSHGPQLQKIKEYCDFLTGEAFAELFKSKCEAIFRELIRPGSHIGKQIAIELEKYSEATVFKLPAGPSSRVYVDMRLISNSSTLLKYINKSLKPSPALSEHVEKQRIQFISEYIESLRRYIQIPTILDIDTSVELIDSRQGRTKVAVRSIKLDVMYDFVASMHASSETHFGQVPRADILFGLHTFLGYLLDRYGIIETATKVERNNLGVFGDRVDAVGTLAESSENLFITGDPGGGKTFTAQELTLRLLRNGHDVVYFPCSHIKKTEPLSDSIVSYICSISGCTAADAKRYLQAASTIVIDGLDEATTLNAGLLSEIREMAYPVKIAINAEGSRAPEIELLTESTRSKVSYRDRKDKVTVTASERLHWDEANLLCHLLYKEESALSSQRRLLRSQPRIIATCRQASNLELDASFRRLCLLPFSEDELNTFIHKHCQAAKKSPEALLAFLKDNHHIAEVCKSPLTASIMIGIYLRDAHLPSCRSELYEIRANLLMREWDAVRHVTRPTEGSESTKLDILSFLAYHMHKNGWVEIAKHDAIAVVTKTYTAASLGVSVKALISDLVEHHGLLCERYDGTLTFGHLSHQEFFCARHILVRQQIDYLAKQFGEPWWRNSILFFVGLTGTADDLLRKAQKRNTLTQNESFIRELIDEGKYSNDFSRFILEQFEVLRLERLE